MHVSLLIIFQVDCILFSDLLINSSQYVAVAEFYEVYNIDVHFNFNFSFYCLTVNSKIVQKTSKNIIWIHIEIMTQFKQLMFVFFTRPMMTQQ
jgi:hypothetical protein